MIFSSTIFLFAFLPCALLCYFIVPARLKNPVLLAASLLFYAWGELAYTLIMIVSIGWNYLLGRLIDGPIGRRKMFLIAGVAGNLLLLGYFKYANFLVDNLSALWEIFGVRQIHVHSIHLPLGISFFTFQAISYLVDVYRRETRCQKNLLTLGLYISMFPQLIAGPIVRYGTVARQLVSRKITLAGMEQGVMRFVYGLAKKLLIANPLGEVADALFALPAGELTALSAWVAITAYTLQIYFDFSGYSDMAIGLGRMFGFTFPENFNYPYIATTVREFWRRWHISLTIWLRDYLYIPLGGNRRGHHRVAFNLIIVFLLCGLWHGASWTFIVWGIWHGCFLLLERYRLGRILDTLPRAVRHGYLLIVVVLGWVFFRAETLSDAMAILQAMAGLQGWSSTLHPLQLYVSNETMLAFGAGCLLATPVFQLIRKRFEFGVPGFVMRLSLLVILLYGSFMKISSGTYNPFLYFRF